ncbi:MAG: Ig-like domain-containing protein [Verrucomicrobia bacterium]|nr:Ig-like domain-containing protein [Verrucomicrobiota bacterium]
MVNELRRSSLNYGGIAFIQLPDAGLNLTGTSYRIGVSGSFAAFPQAPRLVARDIHGNWAMLDQPLVSGMNTFDLAGKNWINVPSQYAVPTNAATFDVTQVTAVGLAHHRQRTSFLERFFILQINEFEITRGTNALPAVALTSPVAGAVEVGDSVSLSATANDAQGAVTRVEFLINGKVFATATMPPYNAVWKPITAGTYTIAARAFDTTGASAISNEVQLTVTADTSTVTPGLTGASLATATEGQPFSFTLG